MLNAEASTQRAGRPYASMVPDGQTSWQMSPNHDTFQNPHSLSYGRLEESSIDPQLRNGKNPPGAAVHPGQQPYPLAAQDVVENESSGSGNNSLHLSSSETLPKRALPLQDVSDETFDDAYVSFIFYCNPTIPLETDTLELRKTFRSPPKSDGKNFSTFTLFELIRKLELKEIKTWAQLAIDLGVEPPAVEKGQSAQKVQQYAVRLKRWMRAMHVDAFFEYLLDKNHVYWTEIPSIDDPPSEFGRDGVAPEEDLALRALLPETRPKRGRRKAEDKDSDLGRSPAQRPRQHSPTLSEDFAMARASLIDNGTPSTARSEIRLGTDHLSPYSASEGRLSFAGRPTIVHPRFTPISTQSHQWQATDSDQTPFTPHPMSAITPRTSNPFLPYDGEPQSAITPSSRSRRRHGPAVSSAWPTSGNFSSGKLRGRPPSNRSISDGPFSTFPANPNPKAGPTINLRDPTLTATPVVDNSELRTSAFTFPDPLTRNKSNATKPSRLYLQVPERVGGAVRLATPPPTVLVNGENEARQPFDVAAGQEQDTTPIMDYLQHSNLDEHFDRELLPSNDHGMPKNSENTANPSFSTDISFRNEPGDDRTNIDELECMFIHSVLRADWLDSRGLPIEKCSLGEADQIVKQIIRNLRDEASSKETFLKDLAALAGGEILRTPWNHLKMTRLDSGEGNNTFVAKWTLKFGPIEGTFDIKIQVPRKPSPADSDVQETTGVPSGGDSEDWRKRYLELHSRIKEREKKAMDLRKTVLDALVSSYDF